jgi:hypothetical protein
MPVVGTPVTSDPKISVEEVRLWLRDAALNVLPGGQGNILLDDIQFTQEEVDFALRMAVANFNVVTPQSGHTIENFPNDYLLLLGTSRFLMVSESFHQLRNQVTAQDGDIAPTGIYDKHQAYLALAQTLRGEWDTLVRGVKNQNNMEGAYGVLGSGYKNVSRHRYGP